jgi:fatty acid desaturase
MVANTSPTLLAGTVLTAAEIAHVQHRSDMIAFMTLAFTWLVLAAAFALADYAASPGAVLLAICLIGARQMALAVLMHECAHRTFFRTSRFNQILGDWLVAAPMNIPMSAYREVHLRHHRHGGTAKDPDLDLVRGYPATPGSLLRKFLRDSFGLTGLKDIVAQYHRFSLARDYRFVGIHMLMLLLLVAAGIGWTYGLWWAAYLTVYQIVLRLRLMGEHGTATDLLDRDARLHTTTVAAGPLQRLFIAPHGVSYHLEHHLLPSVPIYRLRGLHGLLKARGFFDGYDCLRRTYIDIIRRCVSADGKSRVKPDNGPTLAFRP